VSTTFISRSYRLYALYLPNGVINIRYPTKKIPGSGLQIRKDPLLFWLSFQTIFS